MLDILNFLTQKRLCRYVEVILKNSEDDLDPVACTDENWLAGELADLEQTRGRARQRARR